MADVVEPDLNVVLEQEEIVLVELNEGLPGLQGPQGVRGLVGPQGSTGPQGSEGPQGSIVGNYVHQQDYPAHIWTIQHNLGFRPNVEVRSFEGNLILGWKIFYESDTVLLLRFPMVQSGMANAS